MGRDCEGDCGDEQAVFAVIFLFCFGCLASLLFSCGFGWCGFKVSFWFLLGEGGIWDFLLFNDIYEVMRFRRGFLGAHLSYLGLCFLSSFIYDFWETGGSIGWEPFVRPWWLARESRLHFESRQACIYFMFWLLAWSQSFLGALNLAY